MSNRPQRNHPPPRSPGRGRGPGGPKGDPGAGPGTGPDERAKDFKAASIKLMRYCKRYAPVLIVAVILAAVSAVFTIVGPNYLRDMTEEIMKAFSPATAEFLPGELPAGMPDFGDTDPESAAGLETFFESIPFSNINLTAVRDIAVTLVILYTAASLLGFAENFIMATLSARISKNMRTDISTKINRLPLRYFDKTSAGDVISRVTNDVDAIGMTLSQSLDALVRSAAMFFGSMIMMLLNSPTLTLVAVVSTLIGFSMMTVIMKYSQKYFQMQQDGLGDINGHIEEVYSGHDIVKAYNGGKNAKETFEAMNTKLFESGWKSQFMSGLMMPIMMFIGNFGYVSVCVAGAVLAMNGTISFAVIVAFMIYIRLFTQPLSQVAQAMQGLQRTAAASERVFEFFDEQELTNESEKVKKLENIKGAVEFKNVHFGYNPEKIIINDFSAVVSPGQKVAIVGPTGAGKTTMVNLLMRFYEIESGEIFIDNIPLSSVTRENVHAQFCMVLQDTWLFEDTIKNNIIYAKQGVSDEDVISACKAVGIHHFIKTLPHGYDTILSDNANLSAGQKQLLTIARAMIQNAPLLILDEATSSVDTRTEKHVQEAMDKLTHGRTSFVIAHRLSTIKNADIILVMRDGDIVEKGNHRQLMEKNGFYAELYNSQFANAS